MNTPLPEFPQGILPEGWDVEFFAPPITIDDAVKVTLPDGHFWTFFKSGNVSEQIAPFIYALMESLARASAGAVGMSELLDKMSGSKRLDAATVRELHQFLEYAADKDLRACGVGAADLFHTIFGGQNVQVPQAPAADHNGSGPEA